MCIKLSTKEAAENNRTSISIYNIHNINIQLLNKGIKLYVVNLNTSIERHFY